MYHTYLLQIIYSLIHCIQRIAESGGVRPIVVQDGLRLCWIQAGQGIPVVWQYLCDEVLLYGAHLL